MQLGVDYLQPCIAIIVQSPRATPGSSFRSPASFRLAGPIGCPQGPQEPLRSIPFPSISRRSNGSLRAKALFFKPIPPPPTSKLRTKGRIVVHPERVVCCVLERVTG